jgi:hypothetical protein
MLVGLGRFELPTSRLSGVRSNQLSYRPTWPWARPAGPAFGKGIACEVRAVPLYLGICGLATDAILLRKEVIQPHLPIRLPCYDLVPLANHTLGTCLPFGLAQRLGVQPTRLT